MSIRTVVLEELLRIFDRQEILGAVRDGVVAHARGEIVSPPPGHLAFDGPPGDMHVKWGRPRRGSIFAVKVATSFYRNEQVGLPVNDGLIIAFSQMTGRPLALLLDEGWLTSWRTAAAGTLAAGLRAGPTTTLGIIGAGHQAEVQARWIIGEHSPRRLLLWARRADQARHLQLRLSRDHPNCSIEVARDAADVVRQSDVLVTTTSADVPLVSADDVGRDALIVAVGADAPGKQELDPRLFARASTIVVDDLHQCLDHGDFGHAVRADLASPDRARLLGDVLLTGSNEDGMIVADLTGLPAQDLAITAWACRHLGIGEEIA